MKKKLPVKTSQTQPRKTAGLHDAPMGLLNEIRELIDRTHERTAQAVNAGLVKPCDSRVNRSKPGEGAGEGESAIRNLE